MGTDATITPFSTIARNGDLLLQPIDGELVMADLQSGNFYCVRDAAKSVWDLLEQPTTVAALCSRLEAQYAVERAQCEGDVLEFLGVLQREDLIRVVA